MLEARKLDKWEDLRDSDKGILVMGKQLSRSIVKTAALGGCCWSKVVHRHSLVISELSDLHGEQMLACEVRSKDELIGVSEHTVHHSLLRKARCMCFT